MNSDDSNDLIPSNGVDEVLAHYKFSNSRNKKSHWWAQSGLQTRLIFASTFIVTIAILIILSTYSSKRDKIVQSVHLIHKSKAEKSSVRTINYTLNRKNYDPLQHFNDNYDSPLKYQFLFPYSAVIEPHQEMQLYFFDTDNIDGKFTLEICETSTTKEEDGTTVNNNCAISYAIRENNVVKRGKGIELSCSPFTVYTMKLNVSDITTGSILSEQEDSALCLYVRREIRSLTAEDLDKFIEASYLLSIVNESDGRQLYGNNYQSESSLIKLHYFSAAQQDQDHLHEGNGFLAQHLKLQTIFEQSLQAVDPSVTLPYWDFTIDSANSTETADLFVLQSNTFGNVVYPQEIQHGYTYENDAIASGIIANGKWANRQVEMNTEFPDLQYGFGYLRAPWNYNPSPYVSRFPFSFGGSLGLPTCKSHYDILEYSNMMNFFDAIAFGPHGTAHTMIAGFYGCDKFDSLITKGIIKDTKHAQSVCAMWSYIIKDLWRYNYIQATKNCVVNSESLETSQCSFTCKEEDKDDLISYVTGVLHKLVDSSVDNFADEFYDFICEGEGDGSAVFTGDHLESASPADPSFWILHPIIERLFHAKLMVGGFTDESWDIDPENDYICEHSACYNSTTQTIDYYPDCCYGHYENDRLLDSSMGNRNFKTGLSNKEILDASDPRLTSYSMNYIYDEFSWDHCDEDFDTLIEDLNEDRVTARKRPMNKRERETILLRQERVDLQKLVAKNARVKREKKLQLKEKL
jgi:hypothetical protein